jgi:hypothetical protein
MQRNPALAIVRFVLHPWSLGLVLLATLLWGAGSYFFGANGDAHRLKLKVFIDGAAPGHRFDAGSNHTGIVLTGLNLKGAYFPKVRLRRAHLAEVQLAKAVFEGCDLAGADLKSADAKQAKLLMCRLEGADLREADLTDADLTGSSLKQALLAGAKLKGANLASVDLTGAVGLPLQDLRTALNWHLAIYDEGTARTIAETFQKAGIAVPSFATWDAWILEQKKLTVTEGHVFEQARP